MSNPQRESKSNEKTASCAARPRLHPLRLRRGDTGADGNALRHQNTHTTNLYCNMDNISPRNPNRNAAILLQE